MKGINNKKLLLFVGILAILGLVARFSYAYFEAVSNTDSKEIYVDTGTVDTLSFHVNKNIRVVATQENLTRNGENVSDTSTLTATLTPNNTSGNATDKYNLFFVMDQNDLIYTSEEEEPELVIRVTDPNGNIVERIANLDGDEGVFDITGKRKAITITTDYQITATNNTPASQNWTVEVSIVNLNSNQAGNAGRKVSGSLILTKEVLSVYSLPEINNVETIDELGNSTITNNSIGIKTILNENTEEIDKYYYAIEEYQEPTGLVNNGIVRLSNIVRLAITENDYDEDTSDEYVFTNLNANTKYKVYVYAKDVLGFQSNIYTTILKTGDVIIPRISGAEISATLDSLTIDITALDGDNEIDKYLYSIDGGKTWIEEDNPYIVTDLPATRDYDVKVKVVDTEGLESPEYYEQITTKTYIKPEIENVNVTKNANSITLNVISEEGSYEIDHYLYSIDDGNTWEEGSSSKTFSGLTGGETYNFKIKAVDENGRESVIYKLSTKAESYSLPSISDVYVRPFPTTMTINVTAAAGTNPITKYYYSIQDGRYYVESTSSSYTFEDLASNATYYIKVYVEDSSGNISPIYETISKTDYLNPSIRGVYKQENATSVVLTVNGKRGSNEIDGYYYKLSSSNEWTASSSNAITVTGLRSNTAYTFDVKTVDTEGHESEVYTLAVRTLYVDPTVVCSAEAIDYENILVTATVYVGSNPVTSYNFKKGSEAYKGVQQTNTYTFGLLEPGTQYSFSVQVTDSEGHTATNTCRGTTNAAPTPTVTFETNGGSSVNSQTVTYKQEYGTLPTTTKDGYQFGGWYKESTFNTQITSSTMVTDPSNHTLYAKWTANRYTIVFNKNNNNATGSTASLTNVSFEDNVTLTTNGYSLTGHTYEGWATTSTGAKTYNNGQTNVSVATLATEAGVTNTNNGTINLYAVWNVISYTQTVQVRYENADGTWGNYSTAKTTSVNYGSSYSWSTSEITNFDSTTYQAASVASYTVTEDETKQVSIYRNTFTCKINYQLQNADGTYATAQTGTNSTLRYGQTCSWSRTADATYQAASYSVAISANVNQTVSVNRNTFTCKINYQLQNADGTYATAQTGTNSTLRYGETCSWSRAADATYQAASYSVAISANVNQTVSVNRNTFTCKINYQLQNADGTYATAQTGTNSTLRYGQTCSWSRAADATYQAASYSVAISANVNQTVSVNRNTFTITKRYRLQGTDAAYPSSYTSDGTVTVRYGDSYTYSRAATTTHQAASTTASNVTGNATLSLDVPRKTFTVTKQYRLQDTSGNYPSSYTSGGTQTVVYGGSYTYSIAATTTHQAASGSVSNVTSNQTISVDVPRKTFTITKQYRLQDTSGNYPNSYTSGGTQTVVYGGSYTYSIAATTTHQAASGAVSNVTSNQTISVNVPRKTLTCSRQYRLENADGSWGSYTADGSVTAYYGGSCSYSKTVTDYKGSSDGSNGSAGSASASNVTSNQTLQISMYRNTYTLTVTASTNTSSATGGGAKRWGQSCTVGVTKATNTTCVTYATPTWTASTGTAPASGASSTYTMPKSNATVTATSAASNVSQTITLSKGTGVSGIKIGSTNYTGTSASLTCGTYNISGNYNSGYVFLSWARANGVTVASTSNASTTMTVSGAGTLTLNGKSNMTLADATYLQDVGNCSGTPATQLPTDTYTLTDKRDNQTYTVAKIGNYCVMSPLKLAGGTALNSTTTNITSNYTLPASSTSGFSNNNTANMYYNSSNGYSYFSYMAATAGTGGTAKTSGNVTSDICPKNWRLATQSEMNTIQNNNGLMIMGLGSTGYYYNSKYNNTIQTTGGGSMGASGSTTQYTAISWTSTVTSSTNAYHVYTQMTVSFVVGQAGSSSEYNTISYAGAKAYGYPVICITS